MMRRTAVSALIAATLVLPGVARAQVPAPYVPVAPAKRGQPFEVTISVTTQGGGRPAFYGTTNLPDGFEATATLSEGRATVGSNIGKLVGQDTVVVHGGHFTVGPFNEDPFPGGPYLFSIQSLPADRQPESVREIIGANGALLRGPFSVPFGFGGAVFDRTVHFEAVVELK
jgi:hypothetical protein